MGRLIMLRAQISLTFFRNRSLFYLAGLLNCISCPHRADACKFVFFFSARRTLSRSKCMSPSEIIIYVWIRTSPAAFILTCSSWMIFEVGSECFAKESAVRICSKQHTSFLFLLLPVNRFEETDNGKYTPLHLEMPSGNDRPWHLDDHRICPRFF